MPRPPACENRALREGFFCGKEYKLGEWGILKGLIRFSTEKSLLELCVLHKIWAGTSKEENKKEKSDFF